MSDLIEFHNSAYNDFMQAKKNMQFPLKDHLKPD